MINFTSKIGNITVENRIPLSEYMSKLESRDLLVGLKVWDSIQKRDVWILSVRNGLLWCGLHPEARYTYVQRQENLSIDPTEQDQK